MSKFDKFDKYFGLASIGGVSLCRMGYAIAIARLTAPAIFAIYILLLTVEIIATTLLGAFLVTPLVTMARGLSAAEFPGFVRFAVDRMARFSTIVGTLAFCMTPLAIWLQLDHWMYTGFCVYLGAWLFSRGLQGAMSCLFKRSVGFVGDLVRLSVPFLALYCAHLGDWPVLTTFWWSSALGNAFACWLMLRALPAAATDVSAETRADYLRRGAHVLYGSIANSACSRVQPFVLGLASNPLAIALFGAANTFTGPVRILGCALSDLLQPRLALHLGANGEPGRARRILIAACTFQLTVVAFMTVVLLAAGEPIVVFVLGDEYLDLVAVLPWACGFVIAASLVTIVVAVMQVVSLHATAYASRLRVWIGAVSLLLVWPACAVDGARGAYVAMLLGELLYLVLAVASLRAARDSSPAPAG